MEKMYSCDGFVFVGNGFDLHLGLYTSLRDFFSKKILRKTKEGYWIYSGENIIFLLTYFRYFSFQNTFDYGCFRRIDYDNPSWMNVEDFIKKIATDKIMFDLLVRAYKTYIGGSSKAQTGNHQLDIVFYPLFDIFKKRKPNKSGSYDVIKQLLLEDLNEFKDKFKNYVNEQVNLNENYESKSNLFLKHIVQTAIGLDYNPTMFVYNFNYTQIGNIENASNVHGTIDGQIVIGYDSTNRNSSQEILQLSKDWQKVSINNNFDIRDIEIEHIIFYGHSLGEQDYPYFFEVFDACNLLSEDCYTKIDFCYSKFGSKKEQNIFFNKYQLDIAVLLNAYEKYKNQNDKRNTIVTKLKSQERLKLVEIPDIESLI